MFIIMKLAFPPPLLIMLLTELCLIPLFYKLFRVGKIFWDSFLVANSS